METIVTYPSGSMAETTTVHRVLQLSDGGWAILTDRTPFHPLDPWWPDQPSDRGTLIAGESVLPVASAIVIGERADGQIVEDPGLLGRGETEILWQVAHLVPTVNSLAAGDAVELRVDPDYRRAIAVAHSACHIAALAFNTIMDDYWRKPIAVDTQGHNNTDQKLIQSSTIRENATREVYRIGKSARKAGFDAERFWSAEADFDALIGQAANDLRRSLLSVEVTPGESTFGARRLWRARTGGGVLEIPCGGVHELDPTRIGPITIALTREPGEGVVVMDVAVAP